MRPEAHASITACAVLPAPEAKIARRSDTAASIAGERPRRDGRRRAARGAGAPYAGRVRRILACCVAWAALAGLAFGAGAGGAAGASGGGTTGGGGATGGGAIA